MIPKNLGNKKSITQLFRFIKLLTKLKILHFYNYMLY